MPTITTISWQTNACILQDSSCVCNVIVKYAEIYMQVRAAYTHTPVLKKGRLITHHHRPQKVQTICCCGSNYIFINIWTILTGKVGHGENQSRIQKAVAPLPVHSMSKGNPHPLSPTTNINSQPNRVGKFFIFRNSIRISYAFIFRLRIPRRFSCWRCPFVGLRTGSCVLQLFRCEKFSTLPPQNPQHHHQHHHRWTPFTDFLLACTRTQLNFNECSPVNGQPKVSECSACCTTLYVYTHSTYIPTRIAIDIYMNLIKFFAPNAYCMWPDGLYNW